MGKSKTSSKWWRSLLSSKKSLPDSSSSAPSKEKKKSKWAISKTANNKFNNINEVLSGSPYGEGVDANKHAIAVATATAAVAKAALAAAQAAAEVVRLTSGGGSTGRIVPGYISKDRRRVAAAVKIQSGFRAYLARRALRALKGLVKLQALVRGHIVRKQSSDMLHRMQAMARIQARASAHRSYVSESSKTNIRSSNSRNYDHRSNHTRSRMGNIAKNKSSHTTSNWLDHWMEQSTWNNTRHYTSPDHDDNRSDKILEIDTWKPCQTVKQTGKMLPTSHHFSQWNDDKASRRLSTKLLKPNSSISSGEMSPIRSPNFPFEGQGWTAEISPRVHSASSGPNRASPFTPTRSNECSRSLFGDYIAGHPSYMANTESSRAKDRSQSAPKQRMRFETSGILSHGLQELESRSEKGYALHSNHWSHNYVHSGREAARGLNSSYGY